MQKKGKYIKFGSSSIVSPLTFVWPVVARENPIKSIEKKIYEWERTRRILPLKMKKKCGREGVEYREKAIELQNIRPTLHEVNPFLLIKEIIFDLVTTPA